MPKGRVSDTTLVVLSYLERYPKLPTRSLVRLILKEEPHLAETLKKQEPEEWLRGVIRYYRGASGVLHRKELGGSGSHTGTKFFSRPEDRLPPSDKERMSWQETELSGVKRVLIISDLHIPYHEEGVIKACLDWAKKRKPDLIFLNGDVIDLYLLSMFRKDPTRRSLRDELDLTGDFLDYLRKVFPKARVFWRFANHERRLERYLWTKAPELLGVSDFELSALLSLKDKGVEWVNTYAPVRIGKLDFIHGDEVGGGFYAPASPARYIYTKTKSNCICGHFHRTSQHTEMGLRTSPVSVWVTGCLCYLHPDYLPINSWNHGFAYVEFDDKGAFRVWNLRVVDGDVWE
jgi:hypothetical protein